LSDHSIWNLPARWDGPHCHLGKAIRKEAWRHVGIAHEIDPSVAVDSTDKMLAIENAIWGHIIRGWARHRRFRGGIVFWNPETKRFEKYSAALYACWRRCFDACTELSKAELYTGRGQRASSDVKAVDYTGGGVSEPMREAEPQDYIGSRR